MGRASRRRRERPGRPPRRPGPGGGLAAIPGAAEMVGAWNRLEAAAMNVVQQGASVADFARLGTGELATAVSVLAAALEGDEQEDGSHLMALDELEDGSRWVSRACTVSVVEAVRSGLSFDELAFVGTVMVLRGELMGLGEARKALG